MGENVQPLRRNSAKLRVVVVGAGIVGASIAYHLSRRDVSLTIIDQGQPGHGASTTPYPGATLGTDPSGNTWSVNPYLVTFPGNPSMEYIVIQFVPCTCIEEIIIHTRCVPIPEPGVMAIFGLSGLLFLRKRK